MIGEKIEGCGYFRSVRAISLAWNTPIDQQTPSSNVQRRSTAKRTGRLNQSTLPRPCVSRCVHDQYNEAFCETRPLLQARR